MTKRCILKEEEPNNHLDRAEEKYTTTENTG